MLLESEEVSDAWFKIVTMLAYMTLWCEQTLA